MFQNRIKPDRVTVAVAVAVASIALMACDGADIGIKMSSGIDSCPADDIYQTALEKLTQADRLMLGEKYTEASILLEAGISVVGDSYNIPGMIDDTGTKLSLAEYQERNGNAELAAAIRKRVLEARLRAKKTKHKLDCLKNIRNTAT